MPPRAAAARAPRRRPAAGSSGRPSPTTPRSSASAGRGCRECPPRRCGRDCRTSARRRPSGSVAPLPGTFSVHAGAFSRASRLADAYCGRTLLQSHCSSSHTIMAFEVQTPWPSSVCAMRIVTVSSGAMTIQALISRVAGSSYHAAAGAVCALAREGTQKPSTKAPGRRQAAGIAAIELVGSAETRWRAAPSDRVEPTSHTRAHASPFILHQIGGQMNGLPDAVVGAAAAGVGDLGVDVGVGGFRRARSSASALMIIPDWQ